MGEKTSSEWDEKESLGMPNNCWRLTHFMILDDTETTGQRMRRAIGHQRERNRADPLFVTAHGRARRSNSATVPPQSS